MKAWIACIILLMNVYSAYSQYYYNDILTTRQTNDQYLLLKNNHIQKVTAKSFEADGSLTENFMLQQNISSNSDVITTTAEYPSTGNSISTSYYANNRIIKTIDTVEKIKSTITYSYADNNLASITTTTEDNFMNTSSTEVHQWLYQNDQPVQMLLIKNQVDTTVIDFVKDDEGNIGEEHWNKKGRRTENYFYYYNQQHKLTDIVRYNTRAQRLLPDFLFEYDNNGALIKFTQIPQGSDDYLIWQYLYAPNGLKQKEMLFNKQKRNIGTIEYTYR